MAKKTDKNLIVGLDIGTSKVVAAVAALNEDNQLDILSVGTSPSAGVKKGIIVNMDAIVESIQRAVEEAEYLGGCRIHSVYVGFAGGPIQAFNSRGIVAIRDRVITTEDVDRVIEAAQAVLVPADQKILHILPQAFVIDHQEGVRDPVGLTGVRLEADVHIMKGPISVAENIVTSVRRCGLEVDDLVFSGLAASETVLTSDEKALGVCLIDMGAGTTDIAVFVDGYLKHSAVIPVGGDQITNDIAVALRTSTSAAEEAKLNAGCAVVSFADADSKTLAEIIEPRLEELFLLVQSELERAGVFEQLTAGIVITGGCVNLSGLIELAEMIFQLPVKEGIPQAVSGATDIVQSPLYATAVGLLQYGYRLTEQRLFEKQTRGGFKQILGRMKQWFQ